MNFTSSPEPEFVFRLNIWITNLVFSIFLTITSSYLIVALLYHELKVEKKRESFFKASPAKRYGILSKMVCLVIGLFSFFRNLNSIGLLWVEINVATRNSTFEQEVMLACEVLPKSGNIVLTSGLGFVYLFLWFRQRIFYIHPALITLSNLVTRVLSSSVLIMWLVCFVSLFICYLVFVDYQAQLGGGCLLSESSIYSYLAIILTWGAVSLCIQITLLGLFIYPIKKKVSWDSEVRNDKLLKTVKKAVFLTSTCLVSDILSSLLPPAFFAENENVLFFFQSINLSINHMVTIACFDRWKELLWPWKVKNNAERGSGSVETPVQLGESKKTQFDLTKSTPISPGYSSVSATSQDKPSFV